MGILLVYFYGFSVFVVLVMGNVCIVASWVSFVVFYFVGVLLRFFLYLFVVLLLGAVCIVVSWFSFGVFYFFMLILWAFYLCIFFLFLWFWCWGLFALWFLGFLLGFLIF